ncbi:unnamed protein product, partial [Choristocarpus tenellus]
VGCRGEDKGGGGVRNKGGVLDEEGVSSAVTVSGREEEEEALFTFTFVRCQGATNRTGDAALASYVARNLPVGWVGGQPPGCILRALLGSGRDVRPLFPASGLSDEVIEMPCGRPESRAKLPGENHFEGPPGPVDPTHSSCGSHSRSGNGYRLGMGVRVDEVGRNSGTQVWGVRKEEVLVGSDAAAARVVLSAVLREMCTSVSVSLSTLFDGGGSQCSDKEGLNGTPVGEGKYRNGVSGPGKGALVSSVAVAGVPMYSACLVAAAAEVTGAGTAANEGRASLNAGCDGGNGESISGNSKSPPVGGELLPKLGRLCSVDEGPGVEWGEFVGGLAPPQLCSG